MPDKRPTLLIGPLPPGWGGARVSFKLFYDYLINEGTITVLHYNLPVRPASIEWAPIRTELQKTLILFIKSLTRIPHVSSVIVFGSRNFNYSYGLLFVLISKIFGKRCYIRCFGGHPAHNVVTRIPLIGLMATRILSLAENIIVETQIGANEFPKFMQNRISVVVGYRPSFKLAKPDKCLVDHTVKFVYTGAISHDKGAAILLDAFVELMEKSVTNRDIELHLYGSGEKALIEKCNSLNNVFYHGRVVNSQLRSELGIYDVFVFPSQCLTEGHPGSVIEALMAGLPVIASNLSGVREVIHHSNNGLLVEPGNIAQLVDAMKLMVTDCELRKQLSEEALESSKTYNAEIVLPKLADALDLGFSHGVPPS